MRDTRNRLIHEYDKIDLQELWHTAKFDVPSLLDKLRKVHERQN